mgnify:FL=1
MNKWVVVGILVVLVVSGVLTAMPLFQPTAAVVKEPGFVDFKVYTAADCEQKDAKTLCKDKVFYKCGEEIKEAANQVVCDGNTFDIDLDKLGSGQFNSGWVDPRNSDVIANSIEEDK